MESYLKKVCSPFNHFAQMAFIGDCNGIQTHNHLVRKRTLNHLAKLTKFGTWGLLRARSSLTFRQSVECRFTLNLVRDMIITYSWWLLLSILPYTLYGHGISIPPPRTHFSSGAFFGDSVTPVSKWAIQLLRGTRRYSFYFISFEVSKIGFFDAKKITLFWF